MSSELYTASISDIHLGHPNTSTQHILANLERAFPNTQETAQLDAIWIVGDLFDRTLHWHDKVINDIEIWMHNFLRTCAKYDITVRVLEGTRSHDWGQSRHLIRANEEGRIGADIKHVEALSIEYIEKLGIHVLYVPDDLSPETDETWMQVLQLLQTHGLEQVDYTLLHGAWKHQLPDFVNAPMHIPERYLGITRKYVFTGHVHLSSVYGGRLLSNGSFDRLTHGEEGAKGHWRVRTGGVNGDEIVFVENRGAKRYDTIDCSGLPVEEALAKVGKHVKGLPEDSYVRILANKTDPILNSLEVLRKQYPFIHWSRKAEKDKEEAQPNMLVDMRATHTQLSITAKNVKDLLLDRLRAKGVDSAVLNRCEHRLSELIE